LFDSGADWPHASPVCFAGIDSEEIYAEIPVTVTYVDDSTPSTPYGPAEYGHYLEVEAKC
jgi:hypothetical protein